MRCSKARELFFGSCDGTVDEARRMKLQEHLDRCPACASFAAEMTTCLDMIRELPECSPSENFEWNLKRRILQERSRSLRRPDASYLWDARWGMKFMSSAAAAIVVVLAAAWFLIDGRTVGSRGAGLALSRSGERVRPDVSAPRGELPDRFLPRSSAGMRMVADGPRSGAPGAAAERPLAFRSGTTAREDSLLQENEYLRWYLQRIERENQILKQYLYRVQKGR